MNTLTGTNAAIRRAHLNDAEEVATVLCASITDLCITDHGSNPDILARWLANKTPHDVRSWIVESGHVVVAEECGRIVAVGGALASGRITLNYVLPEVRFRGVSKAVLSVLEAYIRTEGCACSSLSSTRTAHRFYLAAGYVDASEPQSWHGLTEFPMIKDLQTAATCGSE